MYIIAGNFSQAAWFAKECKVPPSAIRYIDNIYKLMGLENITIHLVGTYLEAPDALLEYAHMLERMGRVRLVFGEI
jgi:hypothetical protein